MNLLNRTIIPKIIQQFDNNLILILIGARQTGKTYLLKLIEVNIKSEHPDSKVLCLNLEDESLLLQIADYKNFLNFLKTQGIDGNNNKTFILLDEFQKLPRPTKLLKLIYDNHPNLKIIATGSSSLDIYKKMREESMAGRKRIFNVFPLSFNEFLLWQYPDLSKIFARIIEKNIDPSSVSQNFALPFNEFTVFGGYPRPVLTKTIEEKQEGLKEIYNSYIQRDIIGLLPAEDTVNFSKLVAILASQTSNLLNINELANTLNCARSTMERFLFILENTFIIKQLPPYYTNKRKEIAKMPKVYFIDTGLRNFSQKNFAELDIRSDVGQLVENAVFLELLKNFKVWHNIYFWRASQGAEVDFIITKNQEPFPVEVKYQPIKKPIAPSGMKAFINHYKPKQGFVLTKDFYAKIEYNGCKIAFLPAFLASKIFQFID